MAGTIDPIAALTTADNGPINTIVSIVLTTTSVVFAIVRITTRKQKRRQFEVDDFVFCIALVKIKLLPFLYTELTDLSASLSLHQLYPTSASRQASEGTKTH